VRTIAELEYLDSGESYGIFTNMGMCIAISLFSLGVAFISFFEDTDDIVHLFKKQANN
jgi:hypothetical protein